jgi:hypothetical protein
MTSAGRQCVRWRRADALLELREALKNSQRLEIYIVMGDCRQ